MVWAHCFARNARGGWDACCLQESLSVLLGVTIFMDLHRKRDRQELDPLRRRDALGEVLQFPDLHCDDSQLVQRIE